MPDAVRVVFNTLVELLRARASEDPDRPLFTFLREGEEEAGVLTAGELDRRARSIAATLAELSPPGGRALLLYPAGLDFVCGFFGCVYAGVVAMPAPPPSPTRLKRTLSRVESIVADARPFAVLTVDAGVAAAGAIEDQAPVFRGLRWISTEGDAGGRAGEWREPRLDPAALAFIQYTSGSTSSPKGTMVSHANALANVEFLRSSWGYTPDAIEISWVPNYHDDGLIRGTLVTLYAGHHNYVMPSEAFVARPFRWLRAISRFRGTHSGGPNFAYELAAKKITDEQRDTLDLSSWRVAHNAAEPIRPETLERFTARFAPRGWRHTTFCPAFGLAEATLLVSSRGDPAEAPAYLTVNGPALERGRVVRAGKSEVGSRTLAGSGRPNGDTRIAIVDPETLERVPADRVGEIWVASSSIAQGYLGRPEESAATFQARLAGGDGPFLRTGDLGFLDGDELFVVGRKKDLIIVRGENRYPQDIEWCVEDAHLAVRPGCAAAFSIEAGGEEQLAVAAEINRAAAEAGPAKLEEIHAAIRRAIAEAHELSVQRVTLLAERAIPKTSSGKIQRAATKAGLAAGSLEVISVWDRPAAEAPARPAAEGPGAASGPGRSWSEVEAWLIAHVARVAGVEAHRIGVDEPFTHFGLDSVAGVALAAELSEWLGRALPESIAWSHPSIRRLTAHVLDAPHGREPATQVAEPGGDEPIAIIGYGCRVPGGVEDGEALWRMLAEGRSPIGEIPLERFDADAYYDPTPGTPGKIYTRHGGFIERVGEFDPEFFGINAREAAAMDPQQRLLLEVTWEALEHAGEAGESLEGSPTGVFVGLSLVDWSDRHLRSGVPTLADGYALNGSMRGIASGRISYTFGLTGPALTVDTACSSGLVAVDLAVKSLRRRECKMALAGGVNLMFSPSYYVGLCNLRALAPDGRLKAFSADADGYVRAEACAMLALKSLSRARADGDRILGLIRATATNQDGRSNGLTAPNGSAQEAVIREALARSGVAAAEVDFLEAHGTGTPLGDPVEMLAAVAALGEGRPADRPLKVGAVKSVLGHTESAAGAVGLLKTVLALTHEALPPTLHLGELNPRIPREHLHVVTRLEPWPAGERRRIAGVSSFGFSGTNAHVLLEEAPRDRGPALTERSELIPLSARSPEALRALATSWREHLARSEDAVSDVAFTAGEGRRHFDHRLAVVAKTRSELVQALDSFVAGAPGPGLHAGSRAGGQAPRLVYVFSGTGSQWTGMARSLLVETGGPSCALEAELRSGLEAADRAIRSVAGWSVIERISRGAAFDLVEEAQPAIFAVQVALARAWRSLGVTPDAVVGHSLGEIAAAHVAGALSLEDAARVVCLRSRLMARTRGKGAALAVERSEAEALELIRGAAGLVSIAALNGPRATVLSGDPARLDEIRRALEAQGVFARPVNVDVAVHSPQMDPLLDELGDGLAQLEPRAASLPLWSTVTAERAAGHELGPDYWRRNLRDTVRFGQVVERLQAAGYSHFLEVSPHPVLVPAMEGALRAGAAPRAPVASGASPARDFAIGSLRRDQPEREALLETLAALYVRGRPVRFGGALREGGRRIALPTYRFQRTRLWLDPPARGAAVGSHPLLGAPFRAASGALHFESTLDVAQLPYLSDHRIAGAVVLPGSAYVELALAAARSGGPSRAAARIEGLSLLAPLELSTPRVLQLTLDAPEGDRATFAVASRAPDGADWLTHARGALRFGARGTEDTAAAGPDRDRDRADRERPREAREAPRAIRERARSEIDGAEHYRALASRGMAYGPAFRGVERIWRGDGEALGRVRIDLDAGRHRLHPALLDACFQVVAPLVEAGGAVVPVGIESVDLFAEPGAATWCHAALRPGEGAERAYVADLRLLDDEGAVAAVVRGLRLQPLETRAAAARDVYLDVEWLAQAAGAERPAVGSWLLVGGGTFASQLAEGLAAAGGRPVRADAARASEALRGLSDCRGALYLGALDVDPGRVAEEGERVVLEALALVQALVKAERRDPPRLWLVTRHGGAEGLAGSGLWGFGQVLAHEHAELRPTRVALGAGEGREALLAELLAGGDDDQVILSEGRKVARLVKRPPPPARMELPAAGRPHRVELDTPGMLDGLLLRRIQRPAPGPDEVEIEVQAAALNFRDVMLAMGLYPSEGSRSRADTALALGSDCAGRVARAGARVTSLAPGQQVFAMARHGLASHATVLAAHAKPIPPGLSAIEAAAIPTVFVTGWYALYDVGRLERGESVLIHSAMGGTGLAAIQLARRRGAEIFATAGSAEKRRRLRELGVRHVYDSRTLEFAAQILADTGGRGVDVVLNTLNGEGMERSFDALAPDGRFLELGKRDIAEDRPLPLGRFKRRYTYAAIDLEGIARERPERLDRLLTEVREAFIRGELSPPPVTCFPISEVEGAFRTMAQAQHVGKLVATLDDPAVKLAPPSRAEGLIDPLGVYLVTGGLGGLGLRVARRLVERGARRLALLSRRGAEGPAERAAIAALEARGAEVLTPKADVADRAQLARVLEPLQGSLRGVIHAAGVIDDGLVVDQDAARFARVMAPKIAGAYNLHVLTERLPLDFFVLYSSAAALLGNPGQASYAAGNAFLDALAEHRRARGLAGLSIAWGPFAEVGMAASGAGGRLENRGVRSLGPEEGNDILEELLLSGAVRIGVAPIDVRQWLDLFPRLAGVPFLSGLSEAGAGGGGKARDDLLDRLRGRPRAEQVERLDAFLMQRLAHVLRVEEARVGDRLTPLKSLGVDSLTGLELRNSLEAAFGVTLPASLVWTYPTVAALTEHLGGLAGLWSEAPPAPAEATRELDAAAPKADDLDAISLDELAARLASKLSES